MTRELLKYVYIGVISFLPFNFFRVFFYRLLPKYTIGKRVRIGFLNFIHSREVNLADDVTIRGIGNIFLNLNRLVLEEGAFIGGPRVGFNLFRGRKVVDPDVEFRLGKCSHIELFHYFDICQSIIIGDNTVIGGIRSVFWTHTFYEPDFKPLYIGNNCFLGSNVLFSQGVTIPDNSVVAMGSVVTKSFSEGNSLIGGVPAKVIKEDFEYEPEEAFSLRGIHYWQGEE